MDFHRLLAKMQELDTPAASSEVKEVMTQECGEPMGMPPPVMSQSPQPTTPPPSLSVNLNAHGLDDIESIMKLIAKVNPDSVPQEPSLPMLGTPPSIMSVTPSNSFDGAGPLKMLPDFDADNDNKVGGEIDFDIGGGDDVSVAQGDADGDGDHDMDDHEAEADKPEDESTEPEGEEDDIMAHLNKELKPYDDQVAKDKETEEAWENEPDETTRSIDYMNNTLAGGMNRPKSTFPKVAGGDNPMQRVKEGSDLLRLQIRAELQKRLAEAKGAK